MTRLFMVRHGETEYNRRKLMQGWSDSALTMKGIRQAQEVGQALARVDFAAVYASPTQRTMDTARLILNGREPNKIRKCAALRELNFGIWEAKPDSQAWADVSPKEFFFNLLNGGAGFPEGEDGPRFTARIRAAFDGILDCHGGDESILIVSHGAALGAYLLQIGAARFQSLPLQNASVSIIDCKPGPISRFSTIAIGATGDKLATSLGYTLD